MKQEIELVEKSRVTEQSAYDGIAVVYYQIYLKGLPVVVGSIDLRLTMNEEMYYFGNIGYTVKPLFRGHRFAYKACLRLLAIAKNDFGLKELIITCSPDNSASLKTIKRLGAEFIETVDVPENHELYSRGEKRKCIFSVKL